MLNICKISIIIFLFSGFAVNGQKFSVEVCKWYQNKEGAISISFDDASYTQYEYAYPILEKYNIKATISLVGEWTHEKPTYSSEAGNFEIKKMGWNEIAELNNHGYEIAAHGYKHAKYNKHLPKTEIIQQMKEVKELIENNINTRVYTLHYPYSFTSYKIIEAAKEAGFLFCRTGRDSINPASPSDINFLYSKVILNNNKPDINQFSQWINQTNGKWLILMYHHLFPESSKETKIMEYHKVKNTYSVFPETFEEQIGIIANSNYWAAPISTIGKYIIERDNLKIKTKKIGKNIIINTETEIDTSIYNQAISLKITLPWHKVSVKGSTNDKIYEVKNNELLIDFIPGKTVKIRKTK